jgi:hypothetical protein
VSGVAHADLLSSYRKTKTLSRRRLIRRRLFVLLAGVGARGGSILAAAAAAAAASPNKAPSVMRALAAPASLANDSKDVRRRATAFSFGYVAHVAARSSSADRSSFNYEYMFIFLVMIFLSISKGTSED